MDIDLLEINDFLKNAARKMITDNIFHRHPLLMGFQSRKETYEGGKYIEEMLLMGDDPQSKSGGPTSRTGGIKVVETKTHEAAFFRPRYYVQTIPLWETDIADNASSNTRYWDYVAAKKSAYMKIMQARFARHIYSTGGNSLQINGLGDIFDNTNTFGRIDRSATQNAWFRAYIDQNATVRAITKKGLTDLVIDCSDGPIKPDLIMTTTKAWNAVNALLYPSERFVNTQLAAFGFDNIELNPGRIPIVYDKYCDAPASDRHPYYIINFNHLRWRPHMNYDMKMIDYVRMPVHLGIYAMVLWFGQITSNGLRRLGKYADTDPALVSGT